MISIHTSDHTVLQQPTPPVQHKLPQVHFNAHILTSEHCMQELHDKEEKERIKQEEKERKRVEREEHKKVKETSKMKGAD